MTRLDRLENGGLGGLGELDWLCAAADDALRAGEECSARYVRLVTPRRGAALVAWTTRRSLDGEGRLAEVRAAPPLLHRRDPPALRGWAGAASKERCRAFRVVWIV